VWNVTRSTWYCTTTVLELSLQLDWLESSSALTTQASRAIADCMRIAFARMQMQVLQHIVDHIDTWWMHGGRFSRMPRHVAHAVTWPKEA
jgi:hypothetical protein